MGKWERKLVFPLPVVQGSYVGLLLFFNLHATSRIHRGKFSAIRARLFLDLFRMCQNQAGTGSTAKTRAKDDVHVCGFEVFCQARAIGTLSLAHSVSEHGT